MNRKVNKNKLQPGDKAKKILKTMFKFFGLAAVIYSGVLINQFDVPEILPVKNIEVSGDLHFLEKDKIESILWQKIDGGYFAVDLAELRQLLMQQAWIKDVSLRRQWPAGISAVIDEKKPVAYWNKDAFISEDGEVFTPEARVNNLILPVLNGPRGHHNDVWKFMNVLYSEMALEEYQVVRLDLDERRAWQLVIARDAVSTVENTGVDDKGIVVKLGRFETRKRLQRFVKIWPVLIAESRLQAVAEKKNDVAQSGMPKPNNKNIDVIDMRYPNGFAVQLSSRQMSEA